ncbi:MAG: FAD-binding oxidoreductase, partial [candidate division NC10 bacterium]|nr:FAD-binding oxidoreductase [candidate division NC10 bacterium]
MKTQVRVCIIGGGVLGCSIAYYLARMGCRDVLLLEKTEIGAGSTSQAAGLVGRLRASSLMTKLMQLSVRNLKALRDETGEDPDFHEVGSIRIALTAAREEELRRQVVFGKQHGLDIDLIGPAEARRLVPALDTDGIRVMTYIPNDGFVDPYLLTMAFAKGARQ